MGWPHVPKVITTTVGQGNNVLHVESTLPTWNAYFPWGLHINRLVAQVAIDAVESENLDLRVRLEMIAPHACAAAAATFSAFFGMSIPISFLVGLMPLGVGITPLFFFLSADLGINQTINNPFCFHFLGICLASFGIILTTIKTVRKTAMVATNFFIPPMSKIPSACPAFVADDRGSLHCYDFHIGPQRSVMPPAVCAAWGSLMP